MKKFLSSLGLIALVCCLCVGLSACKKDKKTFSVGANNLTQAYLTTGTVDFCGLTLSLTYADLTTKTLTKFEVDPEMDGNEMTLADEDTEFAIFTDGLSEQSAGELQKGSYEITARIPGYSGVYSLGTVTVYEESELSLYIYDYSDAISQYLTNKADAETNGDTLESSFATTISAYEVGDDNEFIFKPSVLFYGNGTALELPISVTVEVKDLNGQLQDDKIYSFNPDTYGFQFTTIAVNNEYVIYMNPTYFTTDNYGDAVETLKLIIKVCDGWNAYSALDLGRISLLSESDITARKSVNDTEKYSAFYSVSVFSDGNGGRTSKYYHEIWSDYFIELGVFESNAEIETISGIFIHNNITITEDDLPSDYIVSASESEYAEGTIRDWSHIYTRFLLENETFTLSGNFFTIDCSSIKPARTNSADSAFYYTQATSNPGHIELFVFGSGRNSTYYCLATIKNLASKGNSDIDFTSSNGEDLSDEITEKTGAISFVKACFSASVAVENCIINEYLVAFQADSNEDTSITAQSDTGNLLLKNTKSFDCFSSCIYTWCSLYNTITNCTFKRFGGPVIVSTSSVDTVTENGETMYVYSASSWIVDDDSVLESYVDGSEAWFVLNGATAFKAYFDSLNYAVSQVGNTIYKDGKFNLIMAALDTECLGAAYPYVFHSLTSANNGTTYNYNSSTLKDIALKAQQMLLSQYGTSVDEPAIIATNGGSYVVTDFDKTFIQLLFDDSGNISTSSLSSLSGSKMYLSLPVTSTCLVGAVIDLYTA